MKHVLYGLLVGHLHRRELGRILVAAAGQSTLDVDLAEVRNQGCKALVFDFDGVLAPHAAPAPLPETQPIIAQALKTFGAGHVYILSNKPSAVRLEWFRQHFPDIVFVGDVRKKPYPDGLEKVASLGGYAPSEVALLDDRLLTGGLACLLAGAKIIYISKPYADFSVRPVKESFFAVLRFLERLLAKSAAGKV